MLIAQKILKLLLMIAVAPIVVALTLFVWICLGLVYVSGAYQHDSCFVRCCSVDYIFSAEWAYFVVDDIFD